MPRPRKCRKVCSMPQVMQFNPDSVNLLSEPVILTVDEYEAIRLIDKQGFSQEECSAYMQVARTTAQLIYNSARRKLADALVEGRSLRIEGGDYRLCDGSEEYCGCGGCRKHLKNCSFNHKTVTAKEEKRMRIAIPLDENKKNVCIVLSRAPFFLIYEDGDESIFENPAAASNSGAGVEAAQFLCDKEIDVLITVRCGENAAEVFNAADIKILKSAHKTAKEELEAYEAGELEELKHFHGGYHGIL